MESEGQNIDFIFIYDQKYEALVFQFIVIFYFFTMVAPIHRNLFFQTGLLQHLDVERPSPTSLFPLCYRHDLCFWLSELASEQTLLTALRYLADGAIHSVRLLRILRHEETDLISYCYRIIYSRCDGPLSHKESVALQNQIRLTLLDLKFQLR